VTTFFETGDWLRYLHEGGLAPEDEAARTSLPVRAQIRPCCCTRRFMVQSRRAGPGPRLRARVTRYLESKKFIQAYRRRPSQRPGLRAERLHQRDVVLGRHHQARRSVPGPRCDTWNCSGRRCGSGACRWPGCGCLENGRTRGLHSHILASVPFSARDWYGSRQHRRSRPLPGGPS
jgi:hypothetical protein